MNNDVLNSYFIESNLPLDYMRKNVSKKFDKFLSGEEQPTFNQLDKTAKILGIPMGLLLLNETLSKTNSNIFFRTINSEYIHEHSKDLEDTIKEIQLKQDFLRDEIENELEFVGKFTINDNYMDVVSYIKDIIELEDTYYKTQTRESIFHYLRGKLNDIGIFVFLNGKYKDHTRRLLDMNEFRGFVLPDKKAPIIFINQADTKNGQLFTLIHELVHIFIGEEEILGTQNEELDFDPVEAFVNKVTAEILIPSKYFSEEYKNIQDITKLANIFKVSEYVVVRRMFDTGKITKKEYSNLVTDLKEKYEKSADFKKKKSGGGYNNNLRFRMDKKFFNYVESAIISNKISYTDAFRIIGVSYKGYKTLKGNR